MKETGFSHECYLKFQRESTCIIEENIKVTDNICRLNGTVCAKVEDSMGHVSGESQKAIEPDKQASKRDLALTMSLAESLMYSCQRRGV